MKGRKRKKVSEVRNVGNVGGRTGHRQIERRRKDRAIVLVGERRLERGEGGGEVKLVDVARVQVTLFSFPFLPLSLRARLRTTGIKTEKER